MDELEALKQVIPSISIFFVRVPPPASTTIDSIDEPVPPELVRNQSRTSRSQPVDRFFRKLSISNAQASLNLFQLLTKAGYLSLLPSAKAPSACQNGSTAYEGSADSELCENFETFGRASLLFTHQCLQCYLVRMTSLLHVVHTRCLQMFIMTAFDMARDMQITPRR